MTCFNDKIEEKQKQLSKYGVCVRGIEITDELKDALEKFSGKYIYRGQSCIQQLETAILRKDNEYPRKPDLLRCIIYDYTKAIRNIAKKYPNTFYFRNFNRLKFLNKLAVLQHHGCRTMLLDFTFDWKIALFFALRNVKKDNQYVSLWGIDRAWVEQTAREKCAPVSTQEMLTQYEDRVLSNSETGHKIEKNNKGFVFLYKAQLSERMKRQQSVFLLPYSCEEHFMKNIELSIGKVNGFKNPKIFMIIIPISLKGDLQKFLKKKRITEKKLLPGEDCFDALNGQMQEIGSKAQRQVKRCIEEMKSKNREYAQQKNAKKKIK